MTIPTLIGPSSYDSDFDADEFLEEHDAYIVALARKMIPHSIVHPQMLTDEIDELAQKIRIKLWRISQKEHIFYPRAYIYRVAHNEAIDMVRKYKSTLSLPTDEDDEFYQGNLLVTSIEGMLDPACSLEQQEEIIDRVTRAIENVLVLPPCQRYALICTIKNQIEDILPLLDALTNLGVDIETINWPSGKEAMQSLRASLSVARKKLRSLKDH